MPHFKSRLLIVLLCALGSFVSIAQQQTKNQKALFEKIIFHTSACYGFCPVYHLEVNAKKEIKLLANEVFELDSVENYKLDQKKIGSFYGKLDQKRFTKLNDALRKIGLDQLKFDGQTCCDGSIITIIVYYQGKKKIFRSMFPPQEAQNLISILYEICQKSNLKRAKSKFSIEDEGSDR